MTPVQRVELRAISLEQRLADTNYDQLAAALTTSYTTIATGTFDLFLEDETKMSLVLTADVGPDDSVAVVALRSAFADFVRNLSVLTEGWATKA